MIVRDIDTVKKYFPQTTVDDIAILDPHLQTAEEKYVIPYLGQPTYDRLNTYLDADKTPATPPLDGLLPFVERAVVNFGYKGSVPIRNVVDTNNGFGIVQNSNLAPASKERTTALQAGVDEYGWNAIDAMLKYLEEHKADFPEWYDSPISTLATRNLVNSATEFGQYVKLDGFSRVAFQALRPVMDNVEMLTIADNIGDDTLADLKTKLAAGTLTTDETKIVSLLKRALANLAVNEYIPDQYEPSAAAYQLFNVTDVIRQKCYLIGMEYLNRAVKLNTELNPPPAPDPAVPVVDPAWHNQPTNKIFVAGY